ncbi:MAG: argininosuccinate synthase [Bacteroides sp. SM23_62_1]|nr:MAG: argininosuccinate synthase [Bacteroides sp. SM23_62_1]
MKDKVAVAFSGGLDTSFCVTYLIKEKDLEAHSVFVDTGGFNEKQKKQIKERAYALGVSHHETVDVSNVYYKKCIRYLVYGNMLRNKSYPMSVSSERTFQALAVSDYARKNGINILAHGSTGAGNDQVRFDMIFDILAPEMTIMAPVRDLGISREDEKKYLEKAGAKVSFPDYEYSINQGLWGTSVGGRETLTSNLGIPDNAYPGQLEIRDELNIEIEFKKGEIAGGIETIRNLQKIGSAYAIGRGIHVGETIIGIKGRVGFEAPAPVMIIQSHQALEKHVLSKWQIYWKDQLSEWYGMMLHEGHYLDPVMRNIETFLEKSQETVTGKVFLKLRPYSFAIEGISSDYDLMQASKARYGETTTGWTGEDVKGFTRILSNPMRIYYSVNKKGKILD